MTYIDIAVQKAAELFNCTPEQVRSRSRMRPAVLARQSIMIGLYKSGWSLASSGAAMSRDHATAIHARRAYEGLGMAKIGKDAEDYKKMSYVIDFVGRVFRNPRASFAERRRQKRVMRQAKQMLATDAICLHAAELCRRLPDEHPLKAAIERLSMIDNLAPTGGAGTTNPAKS